MEEQNCGNCKFSENKGSYLFCRRFPPKPANLNQPAQFPIVAAVDWCGEWKSSKETLND